MNTNNINSIINIFRKRSLVTIAGRPAMGKTTMILGIISELCRNKKKCLYITDTEKERITSAILKLKIIDFILAKNIFIKKHFTLNNIIKVFDKFNRNSIYTDYRD